MERFFRSATFLVGWLTICPRDEWVSIVSHVIMPKDEYTPTIRLVPSFLALL